MEVQQYGASNTAKYARRNNLRFLHRTATHDILILLASVDCGTLTNPANGQVSHTTGTTLGQTATYSCNPGYNLVGGGTRTCQDTGVWSGSAPTCQGTLLPPCMHVFMCTNIWSICKHNGGSHSL